jgi:hypothetical protein
MTAGLERPDTIYQTRRHLPPSVIKQCAGDRGMLSSSESPSAAVVLNTEQRPHKLASTCEATKCGVGPTATLRLSNCEDDRNRDEVGFFADTKKATEGEPTSPN